MGPPTIAWDYDVRAIGGKVDELAVDAQFAPGTSDELRIDDDADPYVHGVEYASGSQWLHAERQGSAWIAPCRTRGCRVRYRFALRDAAVRLDDPESAIASGDAVVAPPATWLLRPADTPGGGRLFRFRVHVDPTLGFAAGTRAAPGAGADTFEASVDAMEGSSFAVFGKFALGSVRSGTSRIDVAIAPSRLALSQADVLAWIGTALDSLAAYFGGFPVDRTLVIVQAGRPGSPTRGETLGDGGPAVLVRAGSQVTAATTRDDWVVTHELIHVALPSLSRQHVWLSEGIPTYVEPIARARAGLVTPEKFWGDLVEGLPQGLPQSGDEGLERTHTWGRTYWGGALFCLLADVTIRERTRGARSLDDALRGIVATGEDVESSWSVERFLDVGDRATGTHVLGELFSEMALAPGSVDLAALWKRLGVRVDGGRVVFDDGAPLAALRLAITAPNARSGAAAAQVR